MIFHIRQPDISLRWTNPANRTLCGAPPTVYDASYSTRRLAPVWQGRDHSFELCHQCLVLQPKKTKKQEKKE